MIMMEMPSNSTGIHLEPQEQSVHRGRVGV